MRGDKLNFGQWLLLRETFFTKIPMHASVEPIKVWKNPGQSEFEVVYAKSTYDVMRGIIDGEDVYIWDSMMAIHHEIASYLPVAYNWIGFYVGTSAREVPNKNRRNIGQFLLGTAEYIRDPKVGDILQNHPRIRVMLGDPLPVAKTG